MSGAVVDRVEWTCASCQGGPCETGIKTLHCKHAFHYWHLGSVGPMCPVCAAKVPTAAVPDAGLMLRVGAAETWTAADVNRAELDYLIGRMRIAGVSEGTIQTFSILHLMTEAELVESAAESPGNALVVGGYRKLIATHRKG